ncbi:MAG: isochorismatase family protein [Nanoarchaeota archaeon]|nr:isochorismatase family protein [Nanoarchaeota archaeon]MBU1103664.1 isochorismatase family protein [Nanoarchaeota archaeon]
MKTAVYETDVEHDFSLRTGALFVHGNKPWQREPYGAEAVLPNIFALHNYAVGQGWRITGSVDRHFYEDAELIRNKGGVFDDHCMNGTVGQLRLPELEPQKDIYIRAKDGPMMGIRRYTEEELSRYLDSGAQIIFEKQTYDVGTNPNFKPTLKLMLDRGLKKIIFNGFATDYCDKAVVLRTASYRDEFRKDLGIYVVTDAIEEVNIDFEGRIDSDFGKKALGEMVAAGAKLVTTRDVLEERI